MPFEDSPSAWLTVLPTHLHTQTVPATVWTVDHNLGAWPATEIRNAAGEVIGADVLNLSVNQLRVSFATPTAGTVRCM